MELFILIISLIILGETTILTIKSGDKSLVGGNSKRKVYVDTSAVMDPRLLSVAQTGFIGDDIMIPRSVTHELQLLADGKDSEKRARARAGLEAIRELERVVYFTVTIIDDELDHTPVDNRLIDLARSTHGLILTNDYNLQKVAETEQIDVLSLNALALAVRNEFLPGERAHVKVISVGSNPNQGVGYLPGGTMVVIDGAKNRVGEEVEVEFVRLNQTASGTMLFGKLVHPRAGRAQKSTTKPTRSAKPSARSRRSIRR